MTPTLTFKLHIQKITTKAEAALRKISGLKEHFTASELRKLVFAYVLGQMTFSFPILNFALQGELEPLIKVRHRACRTIVGSLPTGGGKAVETLAGVKPLNLEVKKAAVEVAIRAKALARTSVLGEAIQKSAHPEKLKARLPSLRRVLYEEGAPLLREEDQVYHFKIACQAIGRRETRFTTASSISGMDGSKADTPKNELREIC